MKKDNNRLRITTVSAVLLTLSAAAHAETGGSKAMQAQVGDSEVNAASSASAMASAFESDMAKLAAQTKNANAASASRASGADGRVIGMTGLKMLMVKKNEDGTLTIGHVSDDASSVESFLESDNTGTEEE